jgi:hypothetical protein
MRAMPHFEQAHVQSQLWLSTVEKLNDQKTYRQMSLP